MIYITKHREFRPVVIIITRHNGHFLRGLTIPDNGDTFELFWCVGKDFFCETVSDVMHGLTRARNQR